MVSFRSKKLLLGYAETQRITRFRYFTFLVKFNFFLLVSLNVLLLVFDVKYVTMKDFPWTEYILATHFAALPPNQMGNSRAPVISTTFRYH